MLNRQAAQEVVAQEAGVREEVAQEVGDREAVDQGQVATGFGHRTEFSKCWIKTEMGNCPRTKSKKPFPF